MHCDACGDYVTDNTIASPCGMDSIYCRFCWPTMQKSIEARDARYKALGHTGSDMCGCSMCALRYEQGM